MENYAAVKSALAAGVEPGGTAVIGVDDDWTRAAAERIERAGKSGARLGAGAAARWLLRGGHANHARRRRQGAAVAQLAGIGSLRGAHNAQNAACAVAACVALGLDLPTIQNGLASFPGLAHRMEQVGRKGNVLFVNDSKATNADSRRHGAGLLRRYFLDRRRQGEDRRHRPAWPNSSRASARPI